jgi:UDP-3-O-[3-hydroxymyristoyl] glucosamine N-acyltransferase
MEFTAKHIADFLNGTIDGNPDSRVHNISKIEDGQPGTLTFLANPAYTRFIYTTKADIVLVKNDFVPEHPLSATLIRVADPYQAFAALLQLVQDGLKKARNGIESTAVVHQTVSFSDQSEVWIGDFAVLGENVQIGNKVKIYPHVFIDDGSVIGDGTILYSGVKIYQGTQIGQSCVIHSGCVIGADGFGFAPTGDGTYKKIPQLGNVIIEDNVEIGSNTTIDRATIGSTVIKKGTKLDNLIQVAHNCEIGKNTVVASQAGFSGSSKIGDQCMIGGQAGISGHISIGNNVSIAAQSGIAGNIPDHSEIMGSPAFEASKYKRAFVIFRNIEELYKRVLNLEKRLPK